MLVYVYCRLLLVLIACLFIWVQMDFGLCGLEIIKMQKCSRLILRQLCKWTQYEETNAVFPVSGTD